MGGMVGKNMNLSSTEWHRLVWGVAGKAGSGWAVKSVAHSRKI